MASSNIKLFDENKGNMLSDSEFSISNQRMNGLQTGVASSKLQNKAMYQASLVAYAIAQIMMQNGLNANDTDAVSAFVANLSGTMLQKVYDLATTAEAQAGVATGKWMSPALVKAAIDKTLSDKNFLQKSGGTMTGNLILNANPTAKLGAATKQYVDSAKSSLQTEINAVKPVFADLTKNGWYKLTDFSNSSHSNALFINDLLSKLQVITNNAKITEAMLVTNIAVNVDSAIYVYSKYTDFTKGIRLYTYSASEGYLNAYFGFQVYSNKNGQYNFKAYNDSGVSILSTQKNLYLISNTSSSVLTGTAEIWYK